MELYAIKNTKEERFLGRNPKWIETFVIDNLQEQYIPLKPKSKSHIFFTKDELIRVIHKVIDGNAVDSCVVQIKNVSFFEDDIRTIPLKDFLKTIALEENEGNKITTWVLNN